MQTPVRVFLLSQKGDLDWSVRAMDKLYTVNEAAEFLRCSARTIRRMVGAGELPAVPLRVGSGSKRQLTYWR
ncbi:helix-turn-helix domain-containing protein, partial [candidate division KSB1 bacterium]|nr:helix-turn-helix domain-containing protein [candidate division KSB1 bacterium]NIV69211.1 helix-turn-helix domain-containing protein [Phycisphaerae bacterium]NIR71974.1 helix-turn-helix domain-containing protein [candidate division KSB1 bacterium]NIS23500.1 helix-turn-helix domain-containing protein [candidate division KSB1 bacterium]NIT70431.1 helix-turn-helix domain-containing protein [candidate division KSB1 bacterium]